MESFDVLPQVGYGAASVIAVFALNIWREMAKEMGEYPLTGKTGACR